MSEYEAIDGEELYIIFTIDWANALSSGSFKSGHLIQNYAQWVDDEATGTYSGVTCNTVFDQTNGYYTNPSIINYKGSTSLRTEDGANQAWSSIGVKASEAHFAADNITPAETYARTYDKNKSSSQACGVGHVIYHTVSEEAPDTDSLELNEAYWLAKNSDSSVKIWSGVRVYESSSSSSPFLSADA